MSYPSLLTKIVFLLLFVSSCSLGAGNTISATHEVPYTDFPVIPVSHIHGTGMTEAAHWIEDACLIGLVLLPEERGTANPSSGLMEFVSISSMERILIEFTYTDELSIESIHEVMQMPQEYWQCIDLEQLAVDTDELIEISFLNGGREYLESIETQDWDISILLDGLCRLVSSEDPCWEIHYYPVPRTNYLTITIDAYTNELLDIIEREYPILK